ncbi:MAG: hypothetical protein HQL23_07890, partial [Candidatus Omnitrophica bacterium]|nr:hypothetical protein [Candidatus Omnitrophota bacterium]
FRRARFERRLGFRIESKTLGQSKAVLAGASLPQTHPFRYFRELKKILQEETAAASLRRLKQWSAFRLFGEAQDFDPEAAIRLDKKWETSRLALAGRFTGEIWLPRLLALTARFSLPVLEKFGRDVHLTKAEMLAMRQSRQGPEIARLLSGQRKKSEIYRGLIRFSPAALVYFRLRAAAGDAVKKLNWFLAKPGTPALKLNGADLQKYGFAAGKEIGRVMDDLFDAKIDGIVKTVAEEQAFVRERLKRAI